MKTLIGFEVVTWMSPDGKSQSSEKFGADCRWKIDGNGSNNSLVVYSDPMAGAGLLYDHDKPYLAIYKFWLHVSPLYKEDQPPTAEEIQRAIPNRFLMDELKGSVSADLDAIPKNQGAAS